MRGLTRVAMTMMMMVTAVAPLAGCGDDDSGGGGVGIGGADASASPPDASVGGTPDAGGEADAARGRPDATPAPDAATGGGATFTRHTVDMAAAGPAYVTVADVDGDGSLDLVVSHLGVIAGLAVPDGQVTIHKRAGGLGEWTKETLFGAGDGIKFPGQTTVADLDGDGDRDIIVPAGFLVCAVIPGNGPCGALIWFEQTTSGWVRHDVIAPGSALFYHHAVLVDVDRDGIDDLVTTGEEKGGLFSGGDRAITQWFKGTDTAARFNRNALQIGLGGGSFPRLIDIDRDGDLDIGSAEFFTGKSFAWFERRQDPSDTNPSGVWVHHVVDAASGPSIMVGFIDDLYGDGITRAVLSNHSNTAKMPPDPWESAIYVFDIPAAPATAAWPKTKISSGIVSAPGSLFATLAAPGIFGSGDMDGDNDIDLVVSGDGDPDVYWLEHVAPGRFLTHVLQTDLPQAGGTQIVDVDGDGRNETIVTGYEDNVVYIFAQDE